MYLENQEALGFGRHRETPEEIELYDYIRKLAKKSSDQAQEDFYRLLWSANTYPEESVQYALKKITRTSEFTHTGKFIINRCFYTIGNPWLQDTNRHDALKQLIMDADKQPKNQVLERHKRAWQEQVSSYFSSDLYIILKRQMHLLEAHPDSLHQKGNEKLGSTFRRYSFIHEAAAITEDIPLNLRESIRKERLNNIIHFSQQLRQYADYSKYPSKEVPCNPTLIPNSDLGKVIWSYRPDRENSLFLQAQDFLQDVKTSPNLKLRGVREKLSHFIREPLIAADSSYATRNFTHRLEQALREGDANDMAVNAVSVTAICQRVLQFLTIRNIHHSTPVELKKMLDRVGHQVVTSVLLRIVLFWKTTLPWMESRFGILWHTHENHNKSDISWVVQAFEHMNVALALNHQQVGYVN